MSPTTPEDWAPERISMRSRSNGTHGDHGGHGSGRDDKGGKDETPMFESFRNLEDAMAMAKLESLKSASGDGGAAYKRSLNDLDLALAQAKRDSLQESRGRAGGGGFQASTIGSRHPSHGAIDEGGEYGGGSDKGKNGHRWSMGSDGMDEAMALAIQNSLNDCEGDPGGSRPGRVSTPEHLANILGFDIDEFEDDTFEYDCIGVLHTKNRARVYHGILQKGHKFLKYIVVVKVGLPAEAATSAKPGNRGKRDSQLVIMGYYNRIHYGRELTELDSAIQRAMVDLNLQADMVRFLMAIDADTRIDTMALTHMVYGMDKKEKVLALCGETKVDNKATSWVTMIQVFEYYNAHHLKKAFEAAFGCVTCLPGCFTMYRIIADDGTPLLPADPVLYEYSRNDVETLHEKNLYHLGEDRMLTTLLLKHFPDRSLTFIPEATCWTIVPHTMRILLSQRRRWINSTVHNMFELLRVNTMCGVCCVSMKVVVAIDLIATMILPASYCYAGYLLFEVFFNELPVSTVLLVLYGIIMGVQVVVFILRSRWDYLWWFFIYFTIGLPVFYLILPVYSFWNMDDFSWGKTRSVGGSAPKKAAVDDADDEEQDLIKEKERLYNEQKEQREGDDASFDSRKSGGSRGSRKSRGSRTSRGSNGSGDRSYNSRTYDSRNGGDSYRSRDDRSVGSGSHVSRSSRRSETSDSRMIY